MRTAIFISVLLFLSTVNGAFNESYDEFLSLESVIGDCDDFPANADFQLTPALGAGGVCASQRSARGTASCIKQMQDNLKYMVQSWNECPSCEGRFNGFHKYSTETGVEKVVRVTTTQANFDTCTFRYTIGEASGQSLESFTLGLESNCVITSATPGYSFGDGEEIHGLTWAISNNHLEESFDFQLEQCYNGNIGQVIVKENGFVNTLEGGLCLPQCVPPPSPSPLDCTFKEKNKCGRATADGSVSQQPDRYNCAKVCNDLLAVGQCQQWVFNEISSQCYTFTDVVDQEETLNGYSCGECPAASHTPSTTRTPEPSHSVPPSTTPEPSRSPTISVTPSVSPYGCEDYYGSLPADWESSSITTIGGKSPDTCKAACQKHGEACKMYISDQETLDCHLLGAIIPTLTIDETKVTGYCPKRPSTPSASNSPAPSNSPSTSPTKSFTPTPVPSRTPQASFTRVPSTSETPSGTPPPSASRAPSSSPDPSRSPSRSGTAAPSSTPARSLSRPESPSRPPSATPSPSKTAFPSRSAEPSSSRGESPTSAPSPSVDPSTTRTATQSATSSKTRTASPSRMPSTTPARSQTPTISGTPPRSVTASTSITPANSFSATSSYTPVPSASRPASPSVFPSITRVPSPTTSKSVSRAPSVTPQPSESHSTSKTPLPSPRPPPSNPDCLTFAYCTSVEINTLVFSDFVSDAAGGSDTGGRLFIGGNADLNSYSVGDQLEQSNGERDDLVVGGTLTYSSGTVSKGNIVHAGTSDIGSEVLHSMVLNDIISGSSFDFGPAQTCLNQMSFGLMSIQSGGGHIERKQLTGNANLWFYKDPNIDYIGENLLDVYTVYCADLEGVTVFNFDNVPQEATTVINMIGSECILDVAMEHPNPRKVVWNFPSTTSVTLGNYVEGSILAPSAAVNATGMITGQVVANSWYGRGQQNYAPFNGCLPQAA